MLATTSALRILPPAPDPSTRRRSTLLISAILRASGVAFTDGAGARSLKRTAPPGPEPATEARGIPAAAAAARAAGVAGILLPEILAAGGRSR